MYGRKTNSTPLYECDACHRFYRLRKDGTLYRHYRYVTVDGRQRWAACDGNRIGHECPACEGSGVVGQEL